MGVDVNWMFMKCREEFIRIDLDLKVYGYLIYLNLIIFIFSK